MTGRYRPPGLDDDQADRVGVVVASPELFQNALLGCSKLSCKSETHLNLNILEMPNECRFVFRQPPTIEVIACVEPFFPHLLRMTKHLERIFEIMITEVDLVNVEPAWPGDLSTGGNVRFDVGDVLEDRGGHDQSIVASWRGAKSGKCSRTIVTRSGSGCQSCGPPRKNLAIRSAGSL